MPTEHERTNNAIWAGYKKNLLSIRYSMFPTLLMRRLFEFISSSPQCALKIIRITPPAVVFISLVTEQDMVLTQEHGCIRVLNGKSSDLRSIPGVIVEALALRKFGDKFSCKLPLTCSIIVGI
jgi:hypothetical protein